MKLKYILLYIGLALVFMSCSDDNASNPNNSGEYKIAILTDIHVYESSLGVTGTAFETAVGRDRKMIAESNAIFESALNSIKKSEQEMLFITGDLTKDGEKLSHLKVAEMLKEFEKTGKKVYVIPGNHDINNFLASGYSGENKIPTEKVTAEEFRTIYADFGYNEAIASDPNSLTYICEPQDGLWVVGIDACKYQENTETRTLVGGRITSESLNWITQKVKEGKSKGKKIVILMHHGLLEHFPGMKAVFADFIIDDYELIRSKFIESGVNLVFTGHHHAQDIAVYSDGKNTIFDCQTGASLSYPCSYRYVNISQNDIVNIQSYRVLSANYDTKGKDFQEYAYLFLKEGVPEIANYYITQYLGLTQEQSQVLEPIVAQTLIDYYIGDEGSRKPANLTTDMAILKSTLGEPLGTVLAGILEGIYLDDTPDNNVVLNLKTGSILKK